MRIGPLGYLFIIIFFHHLKCHCGEILNPVISVCYGCRIKSGMTNSDFSGTVNVNENILSIQDVIDEKWRTWCVVLGSGLRFIVRNY